MSKTKPNNRTPEHQRGRLGTQQCWCCSQLNPHVTPHDHVTDTCGTILRLTSMDQEKDSVSVMQESVDQLALSMFDSLRLIPFSEEVKGGKRGAVTQSGQGTDLAPIRRAVVTDNAWARQVESLAEGVLKQARVLDGLIDALPGAELREDQQMQASDHTVPVTCRDLQQAFRIVVPGRYAYSAVRQ